MSNNHSSKNRKTNGNSSPRVRSGSDASKGPLNQIKLSKTETKYLDWNENVSSRLGAIMKIYNITDVSRNGANFSRYNGQETKTVFGLQSPKVVHPVSSPNNNGSWKYYRPVTAPANMNPQFDSNKSQGAATSSTAKRQTGSSSATANPSTSKRPGTLTPGPSNPRATSTSVSVNSDISSSLRPDSGQSWLENTECELISCLKGKSKKVHTKKKNSLSRQSVTFAPDTVNVERELKPKKSKPPKNNRKPRFAHPCHGHFLPPDGEVVTCFGPDQTTCPFNPYTKFTSVWKNPLDRSSKETDIKWKLRSHRFHKLLANISELHNVFEDMSDGDKIKCMVRELIPRYILCLDIALMEGDLAHIHQLVVTVQTMIRVLQVELHDNFFEQDGTLIELPPTYSNYLELLGPVIYSLNRISGEDNRTETDSLPIEVALVKMQMELLSLAIAPVNTVMFRCLVAVIPHTAYRILYLLDFAKQSANPNFYIKWVNNSVMHRDYMGILKEFGFCDEIGAKDIIPSTQLGDYDEPLQLNDRSRNNRSVTAPSALLNDS